MIAGNQKGMLLKTIPGTSTRPTTDRVKESIFNIIMAYIQDAVVLDLFSGTGNLGIEALSRGAKSCIFVDQSTTCTSTINANLNHTKLIEQAEVLCLDVSTALTKLSMGAKRFDLIFMDPPYHKNLAKDTLKILENSDIMNENCLIVVERSKNDDLLDHYQGLVLRKEQKYGETCIDFFIMSTQ